MTTRTLDYILANKMAYAMDSQGNTYCKDDPEIIKYFNDNKLNINDYHVLIEYTWRYATNNL